MAMQERVCPGCGAINQVNAASCWRCLEDLHETQAEPQPVPRPLTG
jgi:acetone carboxylase gamma subunit